MLISAVLGLALVALVPPGGASAGALRTGLSDAEAFRLGDQRAYERVRAAGGRFVRLNQDWPSIAPANEPLLWVPTNPADPNYNWTAVDQQVRMALRAGLQPILQFNGAPRWAWRCSQSSSYGAP